jgi:hypothetical protein
MLGLNCSLLLMPLIPQSRHVALVRVGLVFSRNPWVRSGLDLDGSGQVRKNGPMNNSGPPGLDIACRNPYRLHD